MELRTYDMTIERLVDEVARNDAAIAKREQAYAAIEVLSREIRIRAARIKRLRAHFAKHPPQQAGTAVEEDRIPDFLK